MKIRDRQRRRQMINDIIRDYVVLPVGMVVIPALVVLHAIL